MPSGWCPAGTGGTTRRPWRTSPAPGLPHPPGCGSSEAPRSTADPGRAAPPARSAHRALRESPERDPPPLGSTGPVCWDADRMCGRIPRRSPNVPSACHEVAKRLPCRVQHDGVPAHSVTGPFASLKASLDGKVTPRRPVAALSASACPGGAPSQESRPVQHVASAITAPDTDQLPAYWQFHEAVTRAQLTEWLPTGRLLLVDVSGPRAPAAELAAKAGHTVVRVLDGARQGRPPKSVGPGRIIQVIADSSRLEFLGDGCADGVIADDRALSVHLAPEEIINEIHRVLPPAARVLRRCDQRAPGMPVLP